MSWHLVALGYVLVTVAICAFFHGAAQPRRRDKAAVGLLAGLAVFLSAGVAYSAPHGKPVILHIPKHFKHRTVGRCLEPNTKRWIKGCR